MTFANLPRHWVVARVDELGEVTLGRQRSPEHHNGPNMRPYLRVANVFENRIDTSDVMEMNFTPQEFAKYRLVPGDVLLNEGQSLHLVGRPALFRGEVKDACFQNTLIRFRARPGVLPEYALLTFRWFLHTRAFRSLARWTTNIAHLGAERLAAVSMPLAPAGEQCRLVDEVAVQESRLDAAVANLERVQRNLRRYRTSVLQAAVDGSLVPTEAELAKKEGRSFEPASKLLERVLADRRRQWIEREAEKTLAKAKAKAGKRWTVADNSATLDKARAAAAKKYKELAGPDTSDLPELPEGWCWTRINTIGRIQLGRQRSPAHHTGKHMRPYLRVANVFEDRIDTSDIMWMNFTPEEFATYQLKSGDILLNEGQSPHLIGRPAMYRNEVPGACFTNSLIRFQASPAVDPRFALVVFLAQLNSRRYMRVAQITTNIAHLSAGRFAEIEFPLPPLREQGRIADEIERQSSTVLAVQASLDANGARIARLRQSVLKWAFSGRLVDQDPNDEPAPMLLDRIKAERAATVPATAKKKAPRRQKQKASVA